MYSAEIKACLYQYLIDRYGEEDKFAIDEIDIPSNTLVADTTKDEFILRLGVIALIVMLHSTVIDGYVMEYDIKKRSKSVLSDIEGNKPNTWFTLKIDYEDFYNKDLIDMVYKLEGKVKPITGHWTRTTYTEDRQKYKTDYYYSVADVVDAQEWTNLFNKLFDATSGE